MSDLSDYRREFPVTENYAYFNHASVSPLPRRTAEAMETLAADAMHHGALHYPAWTRTVQDVRQAAARLLGCGPDEIALTKNTSEGLAIIANGLDWRSGDVVVGIRDEFPANYFPWLRLERRGVKLRWLDLKNGRVDLNDIDQACKGARLLAVSFVQYLSGFRLDLDAVGEICRRRGALLVVDGVQGLGPFPVDVKRSRVHAFSASAHKWLLGPEGCGVLFIDRDLIPQVEPVEFGWTNVVDWQNYSHEMRLLEDASRYECGTLNTFGLHGLKQSLNLLLEVGVERMARHIDGLAERIIEGAAAKGYRPMTPRDAASGSGIVSLRKQGLSSKAAVDALLEQGVVTSLRFGWLRVAPHFYATEEEVDRFLEILP